MLLLRCKTNIPFFMWNFTYYPFELPNEPFDSGLLSSLPSYLHPTGFLRLFKVEDIPLVSGAANSDFVPYVLEPLILHVKPENKNSSS